MTAADYYVGDGTTEIQFDSFTILNNCTAFNLNYSATLANGSSLPSFISDSYIS
jgi:hypothetical protein